MLSLKQQLLQAHPTHPWIFISYLLWFSSSLIVFGFTFWNWLLIPYLCWGLAYLYLSSRFRQQLLTIPAWNHYLLYSVIPLSVHVAVYLMHWSLTVLFNPYSIFEFWLQTLCLLWSLGNWACLKCLKK